MNIREMAKIAGVSVATISRATNPETRHLVSPETLEHIDALIKRHGYTPNMIARNLSVQRTKMIGVILPYDHNLFFSSYHTQILAGIANFFLKSDYQFKLILLHEKEEMWDNFSFKIGEGVDGLILNHWFRFFTSRMLSEIIDLPCVLINDYDKSVNASFVCEDGSMGGELAAKHLYDMGHRNVAVITGGSHSRDGNNRIKGFTSCWQRLTGSDKTIPQREGHFDNKEKTAKCLDSIVEEIPQTTGLFCCNDNMAFWAIERLREQGLSCPRDISIIGYDDDWRSAMYTPSLTTVRVPVYDIAQKAAHKILESLKSDNPSKQLHPGVEWIPVELVQRGSVLPVK
ncbi:MAG: LacI family DNA-binding transcriptional regulator [Candidatus Omnitrophota bacterium]